VIPSIRRRKPLIPHDTVAYRDRNLIERMYARLKDGVPDGMLNGLVAQVRLKRAGVVALAGVAQMCARA
jgi:hypothetical protein